MHGLRWYAVHTRSNFERRISDELSHAQIEHCYPAVENIVQWKDRKKKISRALFPGYLFIRVQDEPAVRRKITIMPGVVRIVGNTGSIEPIPDAELENIRLVLASAKQCEAHPLLRSGQSVRVVRGPLKGIEGLLTKVKNQTRIAISVLLLAKSVTAEVDVSDIEPLNGTNGFLY